MTDFIIAWIFEIGAFDNFSAAGYLENRFVAIFIVVSSRVLAERIIEIRV